MSAAASSSSAARALLSAAHVVFWDFDGVIKDSIDVKTAAFVELFRPHGETVVERVRRHHEMNGGISRFDKIPLYLRWAGITPDDRLVADYCERFSQLVFHAVIAAPWVLGVREYLVSNRSRQHFVLVTATPQQEIQAILRTLDILSCFEACHGAPTPKGVAVAQALQRLKIPPDLAILVGDTETDLRAAVQNKVSFLLRSTPYNANLRSTYAGLVFETLE